MIYSQVDDRSYYLELFQINNGEEYRLFAKYQQIIGSRLLARPAPEFVSAIATVLAAQLMEQMKAPATPAPASPRSERRGQDRAGRDQPSSSER